MQSWDCKAFSSKGLWDYFQGLFSWVADFTLKLGSCCSQKPVEPSLPTRWESLALVSKRKIGLSGIAEYNIRPRAADLRLPEWDKTQIGLIACCTPPSFQKSSVKY